MPTLDLKIKFKRPKIGDCSHVKDSVVLVSFPGMTFDFPVIYLAFLVATETSTIYSVRQSVLRHSITISTSPLNHPNTTSFHSTQDAPQLLYKVIHLVQHGSWYILPRTQYKVWYAQHSTQFIVGILTKVQDAF